MTKAIAQTYTYAHQYRALIALTFIGACVLAAVFYTVNVYSVVSHTIALQSIQKQTSALASSVGSLDARYLDLSSAVTPDSLSAYGLTQGSVSVYIPRTASTATFGTLAARGHEL
ncbi:MAG: hypothetical protein JWO00_490 [Candidatus Parcubacteria bacterium]|nr:hypothetical protein [Candidatus Parcubacteria bacterium]